MLFCNLFIERPSYIVNYYMYCMVAELFALFRKMHHCGFAANILTVSELFIMLRRVFFRHNLLACTIIVLFDETTPVWQCIPMDITSTSQLCL